MEETENEDSLLLPKSSLERTQEDDASDDPEEAAAAAAAAAEAADPPDAKRSRWRLRRHHQALLALCGMSLVADLSKGLQDRPEFALVQLAICRDHYYVRARTDGSSVWLPGAVDEQRCQADEVQVAVAELRARWSVIERVVRTCLEMFLTSGLITVEECLGTGGHTSRKCGPDLMLMMLMLMCRQRFSSCYRMGASRM